MFGAELKLNPEQGHKCMLRQKLKKRKLDIEMTGKYCEMVILKMKKETETPANENRNSKQEI